MRIEYANSEDIGAFVRRVEDHFEKFAIAGQEFDKDLNHSTGGTFGYRFDDGVLAR